jgi:hypothetical protein
MEVGKMAVFGWLNGYIEPQLHTDAKVFAAQTNQSISFLASQGRTKSLRDGYVSLI